VLDTYEYNYSPYDVTQTSCHGGGIYAQIPVEINNQAEVEHNASEFVKPQSQIAIQDQQIQGVRKQRSGQP